VKHPFAIVTHVRQNSHVRFSVRNICLPLTLSAVFVWRAGAVAFDISAGASAERRQDVPGPLLRVAELYESGRYVDARNLLARLSPKVREDAEVLTLIGAVECQLGNLEDGYAAFQMALKHAADPFWPSFNLGEVHLRRKEWEKAEEMFSALLSDPARGEFARFKLVLLNLLRGNREEAERMAAGFKFPSDTAAYYFAHAAIEFDQQHPERAKEWIAEGERSFLGRVPTLLYRTFLWKGWLSAEDLEPLPQESKN
jgi:tetratricopeptide (TPR) repeat protein